jgi:hypothetical protein
MGGKGTVKNCAIIAHNSPKVIGVPSGWDRLVFRGCIPLLSYLNAMLRFIRHSGILLKDCSERALGASNQLKDAALAEAVRRRRPVRYLRASHVRKDEVARQIVQENPVSEGLICALTCVEPCRTFRIRGNRQTKRLELRSEQTKCLHVYKYWQDSQFGLMGARLQSWLPCEVQVWINGREWLAQRMDRRGITYRRHENCFPRIETTISQPGQFRVYRSKQGEEEGPKAWHPLRKSVVDLHRRAEVSQQVNDRYAESLAALDSSRELIELVGPACRSIRRDGVRYRGLRPWADDDRRLLEAVSRGEHMTSGFTNGDVAEHLYPGLCAAKGERARIASRVCYRLRLLRKHGLIRKMKNQRRYQVTTQGRQILTAILVSQHATLQQLNALAT